MNTRTRFAAALAVAAAAPSASGGGGDAPSASPVTPRAGWPSGPVTVTHQPEVPPVPPLTGVRYAAHLLVVLNPAQAHRDNGIATETGIHRTRLPVIKSYAMVGDHEGYVSIALGLDHVAGFRVGELPRPDLSGRGGMTGDRRTALSLCRPPAGADDATLFR